ncbi:MAG: DUF3618 domain-containing protein [Blastocatellia bacterium]
MVERDNLTTSSSPLTSQEGASGTALGRSSEEIRQHIAATRESITETVDELSSRVQRTFDWKTYISDYPLAAAGVAAGVGLMLGYLVHRRATPEERIKEAFAEIIEDTASRFQDQLEGLGMHRPGLGHTLWGMATGAVMQAAGNFAREKFLASRETTDYEQEGEDYVDSAAYRQARSYSQ